MNESKLCESIKQNLEAQGIYMSETEAHNLYASVLDTISEILNNGDVVDISDFGSFWRKEGGTASATFYKPADSILERINTTK